MLCLDNMSMEQVELAKKEVIESWLASNEIINNHDNSIDKVDYLIELVDDRQYICAGYFNTAYFSINPLAIADDNKIHLKSYSVAGVIDNRCSSLDESIINYNKSVIIDRLKIKKIYLSDGSERKYAV